MLSKLDGLDEYMDGILADWNVPGVGVGVVQDNELIFAKGYGYRDYGNKLPFTSSTLFPIASNTKLFTAIAAGLLVDDGKLTFDKPIRESIPSLRFYDHTLNSAVTLRDMLAHRTGITRHDSIWYKSDFAPKELFERLKFMKPVEPLRQTFIYNNMMYHATGYIIESITGKPWTQFVQEQILDPLEMIDTVFTIPEMLKKPDFAVPYSEKRDSAELHKIPYFEGTKYSCSAGGIISNIQEMSHWLIALMNEGRIADKQVIPNGILKATMEPAIAIPNTAAEMRGFWEVLNGNYGMGRHTASYRGHLFSFHGGYINGFYSQVSFMPRERIGVVVFAIGDHCPVQDVISFNIYERLLNLDHTPWSQRILDITSKAKQADIEARGKAGGKKVPNTQPSHALVDYAAAYEHPAYGILDICMNDGAQLQFEFRRASLSLTHFHYDRFDTEDDEIHGKWSVNFKTNSLGDIDQAVMSLDQAEVTFARLPERLEAELLSQLAGTYQTATGFKLEVTLKEDELWLVNPQMPKDRLIPYRALQFRVAQFSDTVFEFITVEGVIKSLKQTKPSGEFVFTKT